MVEQPVIFECIDDILGPKEDRFFGKGFGKVIHDIVNINIKNHCLDEYIQVNDTKIKVNSNVKGYVQAKGVLSYPNDWSQKSDDVKLKPHLSTIDALILSAQLNEIYLIHKYNLDDTERKKVWIRRCTITAGSSPQEDLNNFDIYTFHIETKELIESFCCNISIFESHIGSLTVRSEIEHPIKNICTENIHFNSYIDVLGDPNERYYGNGYKSSQHAIQKVEINTKDETVESLIKINQTKDKDLSHHGIEAYYRPSISMIDSIILSGQIAQAFLYCLDNISRTESNTLWMRKVTIESTSPHQPCDSFISSTRVLKNNLLNIKGVYWRIVNMSSKFRGIVINYSVAHELPINV